MLFQREAKIGGKWKPFYTAKIHGITISEKYKISTFEYRAPRTTGAPETGPVIRFFMNGKITETK